MTHPPSTASALLNLDSRVRVGTCITFPVLFLSPSLPLILTSISGCVYCHQVKPKYKSRKVPYRCAISRIVKERKICWRSRVLIIWCGAGYDIEGIKALSRSVCRSSPQSYSKLSLTVKWPLFTSSHSSPFLLGPLNLLCQPLFLHLSFPEVLRIASRRSPAIRVGCASTNRYSRGQHCIQHFCKTFGCPPSFSASGLTNMVRE